MELTEQQGRVMAAIRSLVAEDKQPTMKTIRLRAGIGQVRCGTSVAALIKMELLRRGPRPFQRLTLVEDAPPKEPTGAEVLARIVRYLRCHEQHVHAASIGDGDHWDPVYDDA